MSFLDAIILGIIEGLTEFLPVSSTGHLILASTLLDLPTTEFLQTFEIAIQLGAILAVIFLYGEKLLFDREIIKRVAVALLPALGAGFLFYHSIQQWLGSEMVVVWSLLIGGVLIIIFEWFHRGREGDFEELARLPLKTAFFIGLFQALAVVPGVSRAGATIIGGLLLGLRRRAIVEFSFLLAVPTMLAATVLQVTKNAETLSAENFGLLATGFIASFVVATGAIKFLLRFIGTHTFLPFGVYRIIIALLFFWLVL